MNKLTKYIAEIRRVREVALHGSADLAFWSDRLPREGFNPTSVNNQARLVLTAVAAKWMSAAFCELSIGVLGRAEWNVGHEDGIYLLHAFNSSRLFAFCERRFFHTPCLQSDVRLDDALPVSIEVSTKHQQLLRAKMRGDTGREPMRSACESWEGPIYLPRSIRPGRGPHRLFWAKLAGHTETYRYAASDTAQFYPAKAHPILEWLRESGFAAELWSVRRSATHARSKTRSID